MGKALILSTLLLLSGCATSPIPLGIPCDVFANDGKHGMEPDRGASKRWTDSEMDQLIVLNDTGERFCRWRPAK